MNIEIREAVLQDIEDIINVQNRSFYDEYVKYGMCPAYNESHEAIEKCIRQQKVYVVTIGAEIIGDVILHKVEDDRYHIQVVSVVPEYHNKGIGKIVMRYIENDNPEVKVWELATPAESYRNHHFYEKLGYEKCGEYSHSDKLIMFEFKKNLG